jgi:hypothetical protein
MKVLYERVAGIDVHKDMIKVAIRSPGDKPWTRKTERGAAQSQRPPAAPREPVACRAGAAAASSLPSPRR